MFTLTVANHTTKTEQIIYRTNNNPGFYNLKINEKVNDFGTLTFSCLYSVVNFKVNDIVTVYQDGSVYWQGIIISMSRGFYGNVSVTAYGMMYTLTYQILNPITFDHSNGDTFNTVAEWIRDQNNLDVGSGLAINSDYTFGVSYDGTAYQDAVYDLKIDLDTPFDALKRLAEPYCYIYPTYYSAFSTPCFRVNIGEYNNANKTVNQPIEFGLNMLDFTDEQTMANFVTSVAPIGKDAQGNNVYITSVTQDGSGYVKLAQSIIDEYGEKRARVVYDGISSPSELLSAGTEWLQQNAFQELTITLSAVDLSSLTSLNYDEFKLGYFVTINANQFGFNAQLPILERNVDLTDPANSKLTITNTYQTTLSEAVRRNTIE